jgi:hypothetical protein
MAYLAIATETEDIKAPPGKNIAVLVAQANALTGYGRAYFRGQGLSGDGWEFSPTVAPQTEIWFHVRCHLIVDFGNPVNSTRFEFVSEANSDISQFEIVRGSAFNLWKVRKRNSGGSVVDIGTEFAVPHNVAFNFDFGVLIHGSAGYIKCYVDDSLLMNYAGDTSTQHNVIDNMRCVPHIYDTLNCSEAILSTTSTIGHRVQTLVPTAAGNHTAWTGVYTAVDETILDVADFVSATATALSETFVMSDTHVDFATRAVKAVKLSAALYTDGTILTIKPLVRNGGTTNEGATDTLTAGANTYGKIMETNPVSAAAWTIADVDGTELGFKTV